MVERVREGHALDTFFGALAYPIRRAVLGQVIGGSESVGEPVEPHDVSSATVSKHLQVLATGGLTFGTDDCVRRASFDAASSSAVFVWSTRHRVSRGGCR